MTPPRGKLGPAALSPRKARKLRGSGKVGSREPPEPSNVSHAWQYYYDAGAVLQRMEKASAWDPYGSDVEAFSVACIWALAS